MSSADGFNSRTPGGVRPTRSIRAIYAIEFQFTHPGRGATMSPQPVRSMPGVSIHAPREGCDTIFNASTITLQSFNSRTPGGVRPLLGGVLGYFGQFQFTHPGRGATLITLQVVLATQMFQFTHPGRGATYTGQKRRDSTAVSIHAPREGCDKPPRYVLRSPL